MRFAMFWWHLMCVFWVRQAGVCRGRQTDRWMIAVISEHTGCFILSLSFSAVAHDFLPSSCKSVSVLCSSSTGPVRGTFWGYFKSQTVALQSRIIGKSRKDATPMQNINFSLSPHARDWKGIKEVTHRSSLEKKKNQHFPSHLLSGLWCLLLMEPENTAGLMKKLHRDWKNGPCWCLLMTTVSDKRTSQDCKPMHTFTPTLTVSLMFISSHIQLWLVQIIRFKAN